MHNAWMAAALVASAGWAGPYSPPAGGAGSEAVPADSPRLAGWAVVYTNYVVGAECDVGFQTPSRALGPATGDVYDIVSLGRGGVITLGFEPPIADGPGDDFAVFENAVADTFLELAAVEVSSDGTHFVRFASDSLTPAPVAAFGAVDPTDVHGLAGTFAVGYGTPFDLADLPPATALDPGQVRWVRIVDIVGDGSQADADGDPIYDPYPTVQSAGFDLEAVGVIHQGIRAAFAGVDASGLHLAFPTGLHRSYQLEFTSDLTPSGAWTPVGDAVSGNGGLRTLVHTDPPPGGAYRVRITTEGEP